MNDAQIIKEQQQEIDILKGEVNKYKPVPVGEFVSKAKSTFMGMAKKPI